MKYWPEAPESVKTCEESLKTYDVYQGTLTIKHLSTTSNTDYDLREFELTKTEKKVCMHARR